MAKTTAAQKRRSTLELFLAIALLILLCAILFVELSRGAAVIWRESAALAAYTLEDSYEGYVFRDEETVDVANMNNGPIEYICKNGESVVGKSTLLAKVYRDSNNETRQPVAALYREIAALEATLAEADDPWQTTCLSSWLTLTAAAGGGSWQGADQAADALALSLSRGDVARSPVENRAEIEQKIAALRAEIQAIGSDNISFDDPQTVTAKNDGVFYDSFDGLEAQFGTAMIATLTPESLAANLSAGPQRTDNAIGRLVTSKDFYLVLPVSASEAAAYTVGNEYALRFTRNNLCLSMELQDARLSGDSAILIFYSDEASTALDLSRRQNVVIERDSVSGIALPESAVQQEGERFFVFAEIDGKAEKRWVEPIFSHNGVLLAAPSEEPGYLKEGDAILVTARSLYEGKVMD